MDISSKIRGLKFMQRGDAKKAAVAEAASFPSKMDMEVTSSNPIFTNTTSKSSSHITFQYEPSLIRLLEGSRPADGRSNLVRRRFKDFAAVKKTNLNDEDVEMEDGQPSGEQLVKRHQEKASSAAASEKMARKATSSVTNAAASTAKKKYFNKAASSSSTSKKSNNKMN